MKFLNLLSNIKHATKNQKQKELWDVEGILHNQSFKFDLRPLNNSTKKGTFKTKADKIVYDLKDEYTIVDVEELLMNLEWNIVIQKV